MTYVSWRPMRHLVGSALALGAIAAASSSQQFLGVDRLGDVVRTDPSTGSSTLVGPSGFANANSMARDSTGTIYAIVDGAPGASELIRVDPAVGAATSVSTIAIGEIQGAAFDAADVLFVAVAAPTLVGGGGSDLYTVDVASGALTYVGYTASADAIQGLAFFGGVLYGWDLGHPGLITIDVGTALATPVGAPVSPATKVQSLHFAPDGTLFGASTDLHVIDPATGLASKVGATGFDLRGMEVDADFYGSPARLSVSSGGTQSLTYLAGPGFAGDSYLVLGSVSGTAPGTAYAGVSVPLNFDGYLNFTLTNPNSPLLPGSGGQLDASGKAQLAFVLPAGSSASLVGLTAHHAGVVLQLVGGGIGIAHASQAVVVTLDP